MTYNQYLLLTEGAKFSANHLKSIGAFAKLKGTQPDTVKKALAEKAKRMFAKIRKPAPKLNIRKALTLNPGILSK